MIIRRIERRKIFQSGYDRENFITQLSELIPESKIDCYEWGLDPITVFSVFIKTMGQADSAGHK